MCDQTSSEEDRVAKRKWRPWARMGLPEAEAGRSPSEAFRWRYPRQKRFPTVFYEDQSVLDLMGAVEAAACAKNPSTL
jgi:hypothetical protein